MPAPAPGSVFPRLDLRNSDGHPATLPSGETLYAFFKTSCPVCELTWPYLDRIRERRGEGGLEIVGVSQDDPKKTRAFLERLENSVPTLYDPPPWKASASLGLTTVPTLLLVSSSGGILETVEGFQKKKLEELASRAAAAGSARVPLFGPRDAVPAMRPG